VWSASDTATGAQSTSARRRLPPDLGERQIAAVAPNVLDCGFEAMRLATIINVSGPPGGRPDCFVAAGP
jgi:hypothetical protein